MLLQEAIRHLLEDPADRVLATQILGTLDPDTIAAMVEGHVGPVADCIEISQSVGTVFLLELSDGREVALKIHELSNRSGGVASLEELAAVYAAQARFASAGIPCAHVIDSPRPFGPGAAAVMSRLHHPPRDDPHDPAVAVALARLLARITEVGTTLPVTLRRSLLPPTLFGRPHNALFDLSDPGGAWIDSRAREARRVLDEAVPLLPMHGDVSCANVVVSGGDVAAVFDMDSVVLIDEMRCVATTAVHYTYTGVRGWTWPSRDEARQFVAHYRQPSSAEWRRLDAAAIYAMAYTARCEVGVGGGPMCDQLANAPDAYLSA
jgi:hypothetical protein